MLNDNYAKVYAMLMIYNVPFSSYLLDGVYIMKTKEYTITVAEDKCTLNNKEYTDVQDLLRDLRF